MAFFELYRLPIKPVMSFEEFAWWFVPGEEPLMIDLDCSSELRFGCEFSPPSMPTPTIVLCLLSISRREFADPDPKEKAPLG